MDETESAAETGNQPGEAKKSKVTFLGKTANKAAAVVAAATVAGGTLAGIEMSRASGPEIKADVAYQKYGTEGFPRPTVIKNSQGTVMNIELVPSSNPYEQAQQLLWLMEHNEITNHYWDGVLVLPAGTVLYHAPLDSAFISANPTNKGEADKVVVPPNSVMVIKRPRIIATTRDEPDYVVVTPDSDQSDTNRATDVRQVYWLNLKSADAQPGTRAYAYKGIFPNIEAAGSVDDNGNPQFNNVPFKELATFSIVPETSLKSIEAELQLEPKPLAYPPYY